MNNIRGKIIEKKYAVADVKVKVVEKKIHSIPFVRREFHSDNFFPRTSTLWNRLARGCLWNTTFITSS